MRRRKTFVMAIMGLFALAAVGCQSEGQQAEGTKKGSESSSGILSFFSKPEVTLAEGTAVKVRTNVALSTKTHKSGDEFSASLVEPIVAGNRVVAPRGAEVRGVVAESDSGGRVKGRAHLAIRLTELKAAGGDWAEINTNTVTRTARSTKKKDAAKIGAASGVGAAVGAIAGGGKGAAIGAAAGGGAGTGVVLATKGAPAVIPNETVLTFRLTAPAEVRVES